jgi:arginase
MTKTKQKQTLRLILPQWQGGNNPVYHFGSQLLAWLAPDNGQETVEIPVEEPKAPHEDLVDGIVAKKQLLKQIENTMDVLKEREPDRVVVLGGDCSVELAPFSYLAERYDDDLAILWIDAHPDITTPEMFQNYHAMVLASIVGEGDADFAALVPTKVKSSRVVFAGINDESEKDRPVYRKFNFESVNSAAFASSSESVLDMLKRTGASKVAVHFDLDVLDIRELRSLYFTRPGEYEQNLREMPKGASIESTVRLIQDVAAEFDVVGLGITEHLPWDAITLSSMLRSLPLLND